MDKVKTQKISRAKPRAHYALFAENTPFKQKVVERKDVYQRNSKHKKSHLLDLT